MEKKFILPKNSDYKRVTKRNESFGNKHYILYFKKNSLDHSRFGITITKKVGNAVVRNRLRRQLKEILRKHINHLKCGYDYVFILKCEIAGLQFSEMERSAIHVLKKSGGLI